METADSSRITDFPKKIKRGWRKSVLFGNFLRLLRLGGGFLLKSVKRKRILARFRSATNSQCHRRRNAVWILNPKEKHRTCRNFRRREIKNFRNVPKIRKRSGRYVRIGKQRSQIKARNRAPEFLAIRSTQKEPDSPHVVSRRETGIRPIE